MSPKRKARPPWQESEPDLKIANGSSQSQVYAPKAPDTRKSLGALPWETATFVRALHGDGRGFVRFLSRERGFGHRCDTYCIAPDAIGQALKLVGETDVYVSGNEWPRRSTDKLLGVRAIWLDLDYYGVEALEGLPVQEVAHLTYDRLRATGIPLANLVVFTGRGLQLVWTFSPVKSQAGRKASAAMKRLVDIFRDMGADPQCTDVSRVLRLPGSINSKSGISARLIRWCDEHVFDDLCAAIFAASGADPLNTTKLTESQPRRCPGDRSKPKPASSQRTEPSRQAPRQQGSYKNYLASQRIADLSRLVLARWGGAVPNGSRNLITHLVAVHAAHLRGDTLDCVRAWCAKWCPTIAQGEIVRAVRCAERKRYRYRARTLGDRLQLTSEERRRACITTIQASDLTPEDTERNRRAHEVLRARRRRVAAGATPRHMSQAQTKPWELQGMSERTWRRRRAERLQNMGGSVSSASNTLSDERIAKRDTASGSRRTSRRLRGLSPRIPGEPQKHPVEPREPAARLLEMVLQHERLESVLDSLLGRRGQVNLGSLQNAQRGSIRDRLAESLGDVAHFLGQHLLAGHEERLSFLDDASLDLRPEPPVLHLGAPRDGWVFDDVFREP